MTRISVALTLYNGEKYIQSQIESIMTQLSDEDELVIAYNPSTDHSKEIVETLQSQYPNIFLYENEEKGLNANKEFSISKCRGQYIFLSDQDDVWFESKVQKMMEVFIKEDPICILHNCVYTDENLKNTGLNLFDDRKSKQGFFPNWIKNTYQGSCMAFRRDLVDVILPIPRDILMHDQWIGLLAERAGKVCFIDDNLMYYRRHEDVTSIAHVPFAQKCKDMFHFRKLWKVRVKEKNLGKK